MLQFLIQNIEQIITIIGFIIGFIVGYTKLQSKVNLNALDIENLNISCLKCKDKMLNKFKLINNTMNKNILKIHELIGLIKNTITQISNLLSKMSGLILMYIKMNLKK